MMREYWTHRGSIRRYSMVILFFFFSLFMVLHRGTLVPPSFRYGFLLFLSFSISYLLTPFVAVAAERFGVVDVPNERKVHAAVTPLLGGVAIFIAFFLSSVFSFWYSFELKGVIYGASIVFICGFLDDTFGLSSILRLLIQLGAVFVLFYHGMEIDFIPDATYYHVFSKAVTIVWIIGIMNAVNFLDGLDGLCVGFGAISSLAVGLVAFLTRQYFLMFLSLSLAGSCFGFLPFNFRKDGPAYIFMGSAGSLFIGYTLAAFAIMGNWAENNVVALSVPLLILMLPIFDTSMTTFFRIREKKVRSIRQWLDYVGKDHLHHRIYATGIGKRNAVFVLWFLTLIMCISAIIIRTGGPLEAYLSLFQAGAVLIFFLAAIIYTKTKHDTAVRISEQMTAQEQKRPLCNGDDTANGE